MNLTQPFTRADLAAAGVTRWQFQQDLADKRYRRVLRNVYVDASVPDCAQLRVRALMLVIPPMTVVCDRTAAWLHGVDARRFRELDSIPPIEVVALRGYEPVHRVGCLAGERDLASHDYVTIGGIRVTTPLRTVLDLGCKLWRYDAIATMDALMAIHHLTRADLETELHRYTGRRGVVQLRQLVAVADPASESARESWVRLAIHDANLPLPNSQVWVYDRGIPVFRLDYAYQHLQIAVEYDGEDHLDPDRRRADIERRAWLEDHGWTVIVLTKADFTSDGILAWTARLGRLLRLGDSGQHARLNPAFRGFRPRR